MTSATLTKRCNCHQRIQPDVLDMSIYLQAHNVCCRQCNMTVEYKGIDSIWSDKGFYYAMCKYCIESHPNGFIGKTELEYINMVPSRWLMKEMFVCADKDAPSNVWDDAYLTFCCSDQHHINYFDDFNSRLQSSIGFKRNKDVIKRTYIYSNGYIIKRVADRLFFRLPANPIEIDLDETQSKDLWDETLEYELTMDGVPCRC